MMDIRPIAPDERGAFAATCTAPEHADSVLSYLDDMIAKRAIRPEWCLVAEDAGQMRARLAFWALPSSDAPMDVVLFDAPWDEPGQTTALALLQHAVQAMRAAGASEIGTVLDTPPQWPQWQTSPERRHAVLAEVGFRVARETTRFEWQGGASPTPTERLTFRDLGELGEAAFLGAIARVSVGTYDQRILDSRARLGEAGDAQAMLRDLQSMGYEPAWWQLAYDSGGELVGLVMPTQSPMFGTIGYIGVVPEQRGRGYVNDLLAQGTATLLRTGSEAIRADTDVANAPMAQAFRRAGYHQFATRREYELRAA